MWHSPQPMAMMQPSVLTPSPTIMTPQFPISPLPAMSPLPMQTMSPHPMQVSPLPMQTMSPLPMQAISPLPMQTMSPLPMQAMMAPPPMAMMQPVCSLVMLCCGVVQCSRLLLCVYYYRRPLPIYNSLWCRYATCYVCVMVWCAICMCV